MHKYKTPPPVGYDKIKSVIDDYNIELKALTSSSSSSSSSKKKEGYWEIFQINNKKSRYIYDLYYKRKLISRELYQWCIKDIKICDSNLISKWKKKGYEKLCCIQCIQSIESNNGNSVCICRVPRITLLKQQSKNEKDIDLTTNTTKDTKSKIQFKQCQHCGCSGCASTD